MRYDFEWTIERGEESFDIEIEGTYKFGAPQTWTDPADPDEFEMDKVYCNGKPFELTDEEYDKIETWVYNNPPEAYEYDDY